MLYVFVTSALLCVLTGAVFVMRAASQGSVRAHSVLTVVIPWMPRSIGLMMMATMHCHDVMMFAIVMRNIAIGQVWLPDQDVGGVGYVSDDMVDELVGDIVYAQEPRHDAVCPICLDSVQGVHLMLDSSMDKVRLRVNASRVVVCRVCRQVTHVTCLLSYLLKWNSPQKCPMCNSALHGHTPLSNT